MNRSIELASVTEARERAIAQLSEAFAQDLISVDEFDARMTYAHRATTIADIERLVSDLTPATALGTLHAALIPAAGRQDEVLAIFGGVERGGPWMVPSRLRVVAVFGGAVLDLREAVFGPGVTEIHVTASLGGVQILVPPSLRVEVSGSGILGGFAHVNAQLQQRSLAPARSRLRVVGRATLGGVSVETRLPGESERDAHRRAYA
jgi:hypothetical protein